MKASTLITVMVLAAVTSFSTASFAGCTKQQVSGTWAVFFSTGNYCKLKFNHKGVLLTDSSACVDPDRGVAAPDSGSLKMESAGECVALADVIIEGVLIELIMQFSTDRSNGAGVYYIPDTSEKGSHSLVRVH
jgi:hypothetical protein